MRWLEMIDWQDFKKDLKTVGFGIFVLGLLAVLFYMINLALDSYDLTVLPFH